MVGELRLLRITVALVIMGGETSSKDDSLDG